MKRTPCNLLIIHKPNLTTTLCSIGVDIANTCNGMQSSNGIKQEMKTYISGNKQIVP